MEKTFRDRVSKIVELLNMNGNTKSYQDQLKLMDEEERATLKQLKRLQAKERHQQNKINGTNKSKPRKVNVVYSTSIAT